MKGIKVTNGVPLLQIVHERRECSGLVWWTTTKRLWPDRYLYYMYGMTWEEAK